MIYDISRYKALQYIDDVINNKIPACKWVKLAVKRHVDDLKRQNTKEFPYWFDEKAAMRKIAFTQELHHIEGPLASQRLKISLEPWQQFIDWCLFGWKRTGTNTRRFRKAYIEVARKNGKSLMASAAAWYCSLMDGEAGPKSYCVAMKRDQAKLVWDTIEKQIKYTPFLQSKTRTYKQGNSIVINGNDGYIRPLGKDHKSTDGLNPHFVSVDEYHAHPTAEMLNVMEDGMGARSQPLLYIITTAGFDINSPCYQQERTMVAGILDGTIEPRLENVFGIIFTLDEEDDWTDEKVWVKSNPNLGVSIDVDYLRSQVSQALASPQKQNDVKTKNLNLWTNSVTSWIGSEAWDKCPSEAIDPTGRICTGAFDLSSTTDLTAWVLCFPPKDLEKAYTLLCRFFLPSDDLRDRERRDKVPYSLWAEMGYLTLTPGNVIDYDFVEAQIINDAALYDIRDIACDPYNAKQTILRLQDEGLPIAQFSQGVMTMSGPTKDFERKVLSGEINHQNNPILRWMISCTEVKSYPEGNIKPVKPDKKYTGKRIDGVVASIMALDRAALLWSGESVYETRGVRAI